VNPILNEKVLFPRHFLPAVYDGCFRSLEREHSPPSETVSTRPMAGIEMGRFQVRGTLESASPPLRFPIWPVPGSAGHTRL